MRADFEKLVQSDDQDPPFRVIWNVVHIH
jgi:hypothetical protein